MHPVFQWKVIIFSTVMYPLVWGGGGAAIGMYFQDEEGHYVRLDLEPTIYCSCECTSTGSSYFWKLVRADMSG